MGDSNILRQLKSSEIEERRSAAQILASIPGQQFSDRDERNITAEIPALAVALSDKDPILRKYALKAIGSAQHDSQAINPAVPAVVGLLFNEVEQDQGVRYSAADILKQAAIGKGIRDDAYFFDYTPHLNQLRGLLAERNGPVKSRVACALAFHFMRSGEWSEVASLLNHRDKEVRWEAAEALSNIWSSRFDITSVIPDLIKRLSDRSKDVRLAVAHALSTRGRQANGSVDFSPVVPVLVDALSDKRAVYRRRAAGTIKELILAVSHRKKISFKAIPAASQETLVPLIPALKQAISGANKEVGETAAVALTQYLVHTRQFQELTLLLDSMTPQMKYEVIWGLPCRGGRECDYDISPLIPTLVSLISERAGRVGEAARYSLYEFVEHFWLSPTSRTERAGLIHVELDKADLAVSAKQRLKRKIRDILEEAEEGEGGE